jgi:alkanesulfonate monooxygenase
MRIAARYADEFNLSSASPDGAREWYAKLDEACRAIGRDPATMGRSVMAGVLIGRDAAEVARRKGELLAAFAQESGGDEWFDAREPRWILGTADQARAMVRRFEEAGAERIMLQDFLPRDLDMIGQMAEVLFG